LSWQALYQKAETLYIKGNFELALVYYHRGHKLKPNSEMFRLGIQKAQEAIDSAVGGVLQLTLSFRPTLYRVAQKLAPLLYVLTSPNINRF